MLRILTDLGTEYCGKHDYQLYLAINDIDHTKTKAMSPQTNWICERLYKTILQEFYQVRFRKKLYSNLDELQKIWTNGLVFTTMTRLIIPTGHKGQNVQWPNANGYVAGWKTDFGPEKSEPNLI